MTIWIKPQNLITTPTSSGDGMARTNYDLSQWIPSGTTTVLIDVEANSDDSNSSGQPNLVVYPFMNTDDYYVVARGHTLPGQYGTAQGGIFSVPVASTYSSTQTPQNSQQAVTAASTSSSSVGSAASSSGVSAQLTLAVTAPGFDFTLQVRLVGYEQ